MAQGDSREGKPEPAKPIYCGNCQRPLRFISAGADDEGKSYWAHNQGGKEQCDLYATREANANPLLEELKKAALEAADALWAIHEKKDPADDIVRINSKVYRTVGKMGYPLPNNPATEETQKK